MHKTNNTHSILVPTNQPLPSLPFPSLFTKTVMVLVSTLPYYWRVRIVLDEKKGKGKKGERQYQKCYEYYTEIIVSYCAFFLNHPETNSSKKIDNIDTAFLVISPRHQSAPAGTETDRSRPAQNGTYQHRTG